MLGVHRAPILQLLVVGKLLLGLAKDGHLVGWMLGEWDDPAVRKMAGKCVVRRERQDSATMRAALRRQRFAISVVRTV